MILVSVHGWAEKQKKTKYESGPSPHLWHPLMSVSLAVTCAGQGKALSFPLSTSDKQEHLGMLYNKKTSASPFPLHFCPNRRDGSLKIQVSGKSIVKGNIFKRIPFDLFFLNRDSFLPSPPYPGNQLVSA